MIPELENKLKVTFPPATEFESDSFRKFLDDLCVKNNVECGHPRTSARLLDKVIPDVIYRGDRYFTDTTACVTGMLDQLQLLCFLS